MPKEKYEHKSKLREAKRVENNEMKEKNKIKPQSSKDDITFESPLKNHGCTDILCTILFFIFLILLGFISGFAYYYGNPTDLVLPHDSDGNICGKSEGYENKRYLLFYDLTKCLRLSALIAGCPTPQVCVENCPNGNYLAVLSSSQKENIKNFCSNNSKGIEICPDYVLDSQPVFGRCIPTVASSLVNNVINFTSAGGEKIPNGFNLTTNLIKDSVKYVVDILNLKQTVELAFEDIQKSIWIIVISLVLAVVISLLWIILLRFLIKPMIILSIVLLFGLLGGGTWFCTSEYILLSRNETKSDESLKFQIEKIFELDYLKSLKETWLALAIILGVSFLIYFLVVIFLRKRILLAAQLIKECSIAIISMPTIFIWPVIPFILLVGVIAYCSSVSLFLASAGIKLYRIVDTNMTNQTSFYSSNHYEVGAYCNLQEFEKWKVNNSNSTLECYFYRYGFDTKFPMQIIQSAGFTKFYQNTIEFINKYEWIPQLYVIFMFFWMSTFVIGLNEMSLAGSFGAWYWTRYSNIDSQLKNKLPFFTVLGSFGRAIFYHFGTLAYGSLLIAIVKIIRVILEFLSNKLKQSKSKIAKYLECCLKCCFWCLEKFLKLLNRNAFIITSVYSLNFCSAASKAVELITGNILRFAIVDRVSSFILFLSKLGITGIIGTLGFFFFTKRIPIDVLTSYTPDLNYYFVPLFIIIIGAFAIAKLFFDVFSMGIDSLLICALIDLNQNNGSKEKPYFMSKGLKKILDVDNEKKRKNDDSKKDNKPKQNLHKN